MKEKIQFTIIAFILIGIFFSSCTIRKDFKQGEEALRRKDWDKAVKYFLKTIEHDPDNIENRILLSKTLISASNSHLKKGKKLLEQNQYKLAQFEFEKALEFNPENNEARRKKLLILKKNNEKMGKIPNKTEIEKIKEKIRSKKLPDSEKLIPHKPFSLGIVNSSLKNLFKALEKASGINILFDASFKSKRFSIKLQDVTLKEAIDKITLQTNLFYKIIDPKTIIIIPDNQKNRLKYEELVMKTFFLSNAEAEEIEKIVKALTRIKLTAIDKKLNAITLTGDPKRVKLAEKIIQIHDKPRGELLVEIEIIEVNKSKTKEYGIDLSQYQVTQTYSPGAISESSSNSLIRLNTIGSTDTSDYLLSLPSINYKLLKYDSNSKIKAKPKIRVLDKEEVKVRLGDKVPIPTTTFVPQYGGSTSVNQQPITSYKMEEIGINIDITPTIHHDGLITLKMKFELTFITNPGTPTLPPTIGNRSVETNIKLRDNETSILAGLLRDTERKTIQGFPLISKIPVLGQLFSGNKKEVEQTDIIITLTPRIIRYPDINEEDLNYYWVGTNERPGLREAPPTSLQEEESYKKTKPTPSTPQASPQSNQKNHAKPKNNLTTIAFTPIPGTIKSGETFSTNLELKHGNNIKTAKLEFEFDPSILEIVSIQKGTHLQQEQKSQLLKNIDNQKGKVLLNVTLENTKQVQIKNIVNIQFRAKKSGNCELKPVLFEAYNSNVQKVQGKFSGTSIEVNNK